MGFSLTIRDPRTADPNAYDDKDLWRPAPQSRRLARAAAIQGEASACSGDAVVINELLANSQGSGPDWD